MLSSAPRLGAAPPLIQIRDVHFSTEQVRIRILVPRPVLFTAELPGFDQRLLETLPALWSTVCHNDHGLHFADELRATEMGHVIEHVVLALLTEEGVYARGTTEWNWFEEPEGTFTITFAGPDLDAATVELCLATALELIEPLLTSSCDHATKGAGSPMGTHGRSVS